MNTAPILICYDATIGARRAINVAAELLGPREAIVLDLGPALTAAESLAALGPMTSGTAFEELNAHDALDRARAGAALAREAGFTAEPHGGVSHEVAEHARRPVLIVPPRQDECAPCPSTGSERASRGIGVAGRDARVPTWQR
jgi:hypothetical protein